MLNNSQNKYIKNPYPGIRSFNIEESHLFFGRETQVNELSEIIKKNHFCAITGASGSGKSSVVKAGIIPKFIEEFKNLEYLILRPGNNPIKQLVDKFTEFLIKIGFDRKEAKKEVSEMYRNENTFEQIFSKFKIDKKFLIYIDQFEEIFRYRDNENISNAQENSEIFIQNIISATKSKSIDIFVILSLRSDFLSDCTVFKGLPQMINKGHYLLPKLTLQQKEDAIRKPAEQAGAIFDNDLIEIIREDISNEEISLPVLQHALMRTWDYWLQNSQNNPKIALEHYKSIGTVKNALSVHAENIYNSFDDSQKKVVEKAFRALTYGGNDERSTRSPQKLSQLMKITGFREMELIEVLDKFRADESSFIMPNQNIQLAPETVIDISHESIMSAWTRLSEWVNYEINSAQVYLRISRSSELYQEGKTGLLVNPDLQIALNWLEKDRPNQEWANRYDSAFDRVVNYILYSNKEYERSIAAKTEKQKRVLKRARLIALFLGSASLISILFMIVALNLRFKAKQSEKEALIKQELALNQSKIAEERRKEAVALELVAMQQQDIAEQNRLIAEKQKQYAVAQQKEALYQRQQAIIAKNEAEKSRDLALKLQIEAEKLRDEAIEQKLLAEAEKLRAENSEAKTDTLRKLAVSKTLAVKSVKIFEDNQKSQNLTEEEKNLPNILAIQAYYFNKLYGNQSFDSDVYTAFLKIGSSIHKVHSTHTDAIRSIDINPNGNLIITASDDGSLMLFDYNNIDKITNLANIAANNYRSVKFSPSGKYIVAGGKTGEIYLWNSSNPNDKPQTAFVHENIVSDIAFSNDTSFITTSYDGNVVLWNINNNILSKVKEYKTNKINVAAEFNPENSTFITATQSGDINILSSTDLSPIKNFNTGFDKLTILFQHPNGDIFIGYNNGLVQIISKKDYSEKKKWFAHNTSITGIIFSPKNNLLVTSGMDKKIKLWNFENLNAEPVVISEHLSWIYSISLSKNQDEIISADASGNIIKTVINIDILKTKVKGDLTKNMSFENWQMYVGEGIDYSPDLPENF